MVFSLKAFWWQKIWKYKYWQEIARIHFLISDQTSLHLFSILSQESFYFEGLYFSDVKKCRYNKGNEGGFCLRRGKRKSMYVVKMTSSSYFSCILMSYFIGFFYHHHHRLLLLLKGYLYTLTVGYNSNQECTFVMFQRNTSNSAINFGIQKPA